MTKRLTPLSAASCSTLMVPRTFMSASMTGFFTDILTSGCAARWITASCSLPLKAATRASSRMSVCIKEKRFSLAASLTPMRLSNLPVDRLSTTVTACPSLRRISTRLDPMKPAPPVTTMRNRSTSLSLSCREWKARRSSALVPCTSRQLKVIISAGRRAPISGASSGACPPSVSSHLKEPVMAKNCGRTSLNSLPGARPRKVKIKSPATM